MREKTFTQEDFKKILTALIKVYGEHEAARLLKQM